MRIYGTNKTEIWIRIISIHQRKFIWKCILPKIAAIMMTSSNGNIFRVTGPLCGNSPVPVNSPHKGQWRGALMFTLICVWINGWVNNREAGDLRRYRGHYDVIVMILSRERWVKKGNTRNAKPCNTVPAWRSSQWREHRLGVLPLWLIRYK